jgi:N6-L-threonylcarbamoyladenine synthase
VIDAALRKANTKEQLSAIAFTNPGLWVHCWWKFICKIYCIGFKIPLIVVNHMQAHVLAHFIDEDGYENQHSLFGVDYKWWTYSDFKVDHFDMTIIGETTDDAVGEALTKVQKIGLLTQVDL